MIKGRIQRGVCGNNPPPSFWVSRKLQKGKKKSHTFVRTYSVLVLNSYLDPLSEILYPLLFDVQYLGVWKVAQYVAQ